MVTDVAVTWADLLEGEEIAYTGVESARDARVEPLPDDLDPRVASALVANGVTSLYRHQAEAWEAARRGENVVVTTGTASGKSLAFNLPVLDAIAREPKTRALYLYPTKALAQDQARALTELRLKGLKPAIYDGDTPPERRWQIRKWSNLILTNPDMLHVGVLPHHDRWGDVLHNLRYVVVTTGTASGKSLAFNLPVLDAIAREPKTRAIYLYPTKALAQDQARALTELRLKGLKPAIYDGDTPPERRWQIRKWSNLILTNPDMLHVGVLPHHDRWGDILHNLRYVVVDEAHVYRGVFGSHVANVLRRLRRLARVYEAEPQFLLASATIANAGELAEALIGEPATVVERDTSPKAEREVVIWNPPLLDPELGLRASPLGEAARLLSQLTSRGLRTICFAKSRKAAELIHRFAVERVDTATASRLAPYRAGYTPEQRREIERRLVEGELLGVTATDALELGIDIGLLDCAISVGFPGTIASLRQQWGRAGRRSRGLAVLVASEDALDQFFAREPEALLSRRVEAAILDYSNPRILDPHVLAAAYEAPLDESDASTLGAEALRRAAQLPELEHTPAGFVWKGRDYPAARISLRSGDGDAFTVVDGVTGSLLGLVERERAYSTVHEGAIYLHLGEQYLVEKLDHDGRVAVVTPASVDWYTQVKKETETTIEEAEMTERRLGVDLNFGRVSVTEQVVAYARKAARDGSTIDVVPMLMPETTFETEAIWFSPDPALLEGLEQMPALLGTLHAAEHTLIALLPLWAMCDRWDIGGLSTNVHYQTGRPTIFVYDGHTGGMGLTARGFASFEGWVEDTTRLLQQCPCTSGCPSCVQSPKCGNLNEMLDKAGARTLLQRMLAA